MKFKTYAENSGNRSTAIMVALAVFGLVAPVLTFILAVSDLPDSVKIYVLVGLALAYSFVCFWTLQRSDRHTETDDEVVEDRVAVEESLDAIGEASEFFGSSLKPGDLFRLVSSRVSQVFPFATSALFVQSEEEDILEVVQAAGPNADSLLNTCIAIDKGLAGMAWVSGEIEMDVELNLERRAMPAAAVQGIRSAVAIPLLHEGNSFAVLVLYCDSPVVPERHLHEILESVGRRVAPLFISSISFERSLSNALTDSLTRLPNERAFYMVLENQLAESHRSRDDRPLTVLSIDIKGFAEANQSFGYAAGDRILAFTADNLTSQLRKMDFLSRSSNDEFLIILPTASEKFADEIIQRIRHRFASETFAVSEAEEIKVWLNVGWATFWEDGETAEQLLQNARIRKQQAKAEEPAKILWFPKEYVN